MKIFIFAFILTSPLWQSSNAAIAKALKIDLINPLHLKYSNVQNSFPNEEDTMLLREFGLGELDALIRNGEVILANEIVRMDRGKASSLFQTNYCILRPFANTPKTTDLILSSLTVTDEPPISSVSISNFSYVAREMRRYFSTSQESNIGFVYCVSIDAGKIDQFSNNHINRKSGSDLANELRGTLSEI